jgi:hypothetical protein
MLQAADGVDVLQHASVLQCFTCFLNWPAYLSCPIPVVSG